MKLTPVDACGPVSLPELVDTELVDMLPVDTELVDVVESAEAEDVPGDATVVPVVAVVSVVVASATGAEGPHEATSR